jgi:hypothetical protein
MSDHKQVSFLGKAGDFLAVSFSLVILGLFVLPPVTAVVALCYQGLLWLKYGRWITLPLLGTLNWMLDKLGANVVLVVPYQDTDWVGASWLARSVCEADTWYSLPVIFTAIIVFIVKIYEWISEGIADAERRKASSQR